MKHRVTDIILIACFFVIAGGFMLGNILKPDTEFSRLERRRLDTAPGWSLQAIISGDFFEKYEDYFLDQFAFRDYFRSLKAFARIHLLNQRENNGIYIVEGRINKIEYPLDEKAILNAARKMNEVRSRYLQGMNVSYAVVPDKNYFAAASHGYLSLDYDRLLEILKDNLPDINFIDLFPYLSLEDYYTTDIHWDQAHLLPLADMLLEELGNDTRSSDFEYTRQELYPFYGSLAGQAALKVPPDTLTYLTCSIIENAVVYDYETKTQSPVYVPEKFTGLDPYDVFLSGAKPLLTITNPACDNGKKLIIFRDSFGSSLAPLLIPGYSQITLVDLRYITTSLLGDFIDFAPGQDVLFLYNTQILNHSYMLK